MSIYDLMSSCSTVFQHNLDCSLPQRPLLAPPPAPDDIKGELVKLSYLVNDSTLPLSTY